MTPVCDDISVRIEGVRALAQQLCRRDADRATGEQIGALAAAILGARALRDPAHPRAQQLAELLRRGTGTGHHLHEVVALLGPLEHSRQVVERHAGLLRSLTDRCQRLLRLGQLAESLGAALAKL